MRPNKRLQPLLAGDSRSRGQYVAAAEPRRWARTQMINYKVKPASKTDVDALVKTLTTLRIPHADATSERARTVRIGADAEFEVRAEKSRLGSAKTTICLRYEHPVIKKLLADWLEKCGADVDEQFFTWHLALSPSVIGGIKTRWRVDLTGLAATPVKLGQVALVFMFGRNVAGEISAQLASIPHRSIAPDEFIECDDFAVKGDDPFDTVIYGWRSDAGSQLFAVTASAPAMTLLSLWVIADGAPCKHNIKELPNQASHATSEPAPGAASSAREGSMLKEEYEEN
jgi:hypothetical protein